jgi:DNA polymerase-3 subunit gamma/tau
VEPSPAPAPLLEAGPETSTPESDAPWHQVVSELALSGVARMIAEHSELLGATDQLYRLRLDSAHDTLLSEAPVAAIERALAERAAARREPAAARRRVRVEVEVGPVSRETPAQRFQRLRAERQQAAEQSMASDSTVRSLLSEFGGRLDGVSPLD